MKTKKFSYASLTLFLFLAFQSFLLPHKGVTATAQSNSNKVMGTEGKALPGRYEYVGGFREGFAVVRFTDDGKYGDILIERGKLSLEDINT